MNKITAFALSILMIGSAFATIYGEPYNRRGNLAHKYHSGEISTDEYLDSLVPKSQGQETTIHHSDGSKSLIRSNPNGHGTIYHSDGSKSVY